MDERYEPADITVKRDEGITIEFSDGQVAEFSIMGLRLGCPCATCRHLRDQGEASWPRPGAPTPLRITDANLHGAWGLHLTWNDGHATGIFPFEALRDAADGRAGSDQSRDDDQNSDGARGPDDDQGLDLTGDGPRPS